ncbi:MAG: right-handed parallel beta-helix repeat-containing protein [Lentisphaerae bacterium]|nr:right-handed parallel beta-helix repeat-containing protein [Lentisphaerota bacterium]
MSGARMACRAVMASFALCTAGAEAGTYYVATTGSDASNGLSEVAAFRTVQKAVNSVAPGDTILLLPGAYAGARIERSGSSEAPITLRPATPGTATLNASSAAAVHQSVLELETYSAPYVVRHWTIEGLRVVNSGRYGIDARSTQFLVVRGNTVSNSASTGIFTAFSYDALIEGNTCSDNREHGIYYNNSSDRFVIRGNTLHHNRNAGLHMNADISVAPPTGSPWVWDGAISDGIVENNVIFSNGQGGAGINMDGVERTIVRNNLIYNSTNNSGIALFKGNAAIASRLNWIVNNTIIMGANNGGWAINLASTGCVSNRVFNNLTYCFHSFRGSITIPVANLEGFVSDYNTVIGRFSINDGGNVINLTSWRTHGYDLHSFVAAPASLVMDPFSDLHLLPGSAAVDRGLDRPEAPRDLLGVARPLDGNADGTNAWDIGAYEYVHALVDSDGDTVRDADEAVAGTDATNPVSRLALTATDVSPEGAPVVHWASVDGRQYAVRHGTNLFDAFAALATNLAATPPVNIYTAQTAATASYFRVAVEAP